MAFWILFNFHSAYCDGQFQVTTNDNFILNISESVSTTAFLSSCHSLAFNEETAESASLVVWSVPGVAGVVMIGESSLLLIKSSVGTVCWWWSSCCCVYWWWSCHWSCCCCAAAALHADLPHLPALRHDQPAGDSPDTMNLEQHLQTQKSLMIITIKEEKLWWQLNMLMMSKTNMLSMRLS